MTLSCHSDNQWLHYPLWQSVNREQQLINSLLIRPEMHPQTSHFLAIHSTKWAIHRFHTVSNLTLITSRSCWLGNTCKESGITYSMLLPFKQRDTTLKRQFPFPNVLRTANVELLFWRIWTSDGKRFSEKASRGNQSWSFPLLYSLLTYLNCRVQRLLWQCHSVSYNSLHPSVTGVPFTTKAI